MGIVVFSYPQLVYSYDVSHTKCLECANVGFGVRDLYFILFYLI